MASELATVTVAVVTALAALGGVALTWVLNLVTADTQARRAEKTDRRKDTEARYLSVQTAIELFLRSQLRGTEMDKDLAHLNSVVALFGSDTVVQAFGGLSEAIRRYTDAQSKSGKVHKYLSSASNEFPVEWNEIIVAHGAVTKAMREDIAKLRSFSD